MTDPQPSPEPPVSPVAGVPARAPAPEVRTRSRPVTPATQASPPPPATEAEEPTTTTAPPPKPRRRPPGESGSGASMLAPAALGALASMAAQLGTGPGELLPMAGGGALAEVSDRPLGPIRMDGEMSTALAAGSDGQTARAQAMAHLDERLAALLGATAGTGAAGRATLDSLTAGVHAALTALGPLQNTPAGQQSVVDALDHALLQGGNVLADGQASASATAAKIDALAQEYLRESGAANPQSVTAPGGGPPVARPSGRVGQWIGDALGILAANGYDPSRLDPGAVAAIIAHESAGNPNAINLWDSNAVAGHPSKGLMQTIDSTFAAYALPGHDNIWNPVDNIIAGVRYAIHRYGSLDAVPGIVALHSGHGYVGY